MRFDYSTLHFGIVSEPTNAEAIFSWQTIPHLLSTVSTYWPLITLPCTQVAQVHDGRSSLMWTDELHKNEIIFLLGILPFVVRLKGSCISSLCSNNPHCQWCLLTDTYIKWWSLPINTYDIKIYGRVPTTLFPQLLCFISFCSSSVAERSPPSPLYVVLPEIR